MTPHDDHAIILFVSVALLVAGMAELLTGTGYFLFSRVERSREPFWYWSGLALAVVPACLGIGYLAYLWCVGD